MTKLKTKDAFGRIAQLRNSYRSFEILKEITDELQWHEHHRRECEEGKNLCYENLFVSWHDGDRFFNGLRKKAMDAALIFKSEKHKMRSETKKLFTDVKSYIQKVTITYRNDWETAYEKAYGE